MQLELNHTVQSLLGCKSLDEVPKQQLQGMVQEYPYSAILQLLYAKKLQMQQDPGYAEAVSRTALYFSNPHWLNFQLWNRDAKDLWEERETEESATDPEMHPSIPSVDINAEKQSAELPTELRPWQEPLIRAIDSESDARHPEILPFDVPEMIDQIPDHSADIVKPEPKVEKLQEEKPVDTDSAPLIPIEPYYTIDYFASQGIQLSDAESQDNLGRKLKSFTDWLKTMKKVHGERKEQPIDSFAEERIKEGAELSNDQQEVLTEAMAEVFLKQGLKHKAIDVYRKLSLLNPHLNANFAAKIADLND